MGEPYQEAGVPLHLLLMLPYRRALALKWVVVEGDSPKATGASLQLGWWIRRNHRAQVFRVVLVP